MAWNTPPPPDPPGAWTSYSCGTDYKGWALSGGSLFHVRISWSRGKYFTQFNSGSLPVTGELAAAQKAAEREIVRRVRDMLPSYRAIFARVQADTTD
jgi:hypothetical protein